MATQVSYSVNPGSYQKLLSAGVSAEQIRQAIKNGLDPNQLPPEYFGLSGGYTPTSVVPGSFAIPSGGQIGRIDIPPASMSDPYSTPSPTPVESFQLNTGGTDIAHFGAGASNFGYYGMPSPYGVGGGPTVEIPTSPRGSFNPAPSQEQPAESGFAPWSSSGVSASGIADVGLPISAQGFADIGSPLSAQGFADVGYQPGSTGSPSTVPNFGFPDDFSLGYIPSSSTSYLGIPGDFGNSYDPSFADYGSFSTGSGQLSFAEPTPIPFSDPSNLSQSMPVFDPGAIPGGSDMFDYFGQTQPDYMYGAGGPAGDTSSPGEVTDNPFADSSWTDTSATSGSGAGTGTGSGEGDVGTSDTVPIMPVSSNLTNLSPSLGGVGSGGYGSGWGGYGGIGGYAGAAPGHFNVSNMGGYTPGSSFSSGGQTFFVDSYGQAYSTRGVDPTSNSSPGPPMKSSSPAVSESAQSGVGEWQTVKQQFGGDWNAYQSWLDSSIPQPSPQQYASGWTWQKGMNTGGFGGGTNVYGSFGAASPYTGQWIPTGYTTDPSLSVLMPTGKPSKSGKI